MFYVNSYSFVDYPNQILFFVNEEYRSILMMLSRIEDGLETQSFLYFFSHYSEDITRLYNSLLFTLEPRYF